MDSEFRGFRPIWIVIPMASVVIVTLVLAAVAIKVSDAEQASLAAQAAPAAVGPTLASPSSTASAE